MKRDLMHTPPTPELFRKAAVEIRKRGLARKKFQDPDGGPQVCLLGACALAAGSDDPEDGGWLDVVCRFLAELVSTNREDRVFPFSTVTSFSDRAADAEEIAAFLEEAARRAEEEVEHDSNRPE